MKCSDREVNDQIGYFFLDDSSSFLDRYELLLERATDRGRRCKLLVDIRFAIECALKALIFFESTENEKQTYKRVLRLGHNLDKLFQDPIVQRHTILVTYYDDIKSLKLDEYEVSLRYSLESIIAFGSFEDKGEYYIMVDNLINNGKIIDTAQNIYNEIQNLHPYPFDVRNMADLDIEKIIEMKGRIQNVSV